MADGGYSGEGRKEVQAPLRSRTVGFPQSGSDLGWSLLCPALQVLTPKVACRLDRSAFTVRLYAIFLNQSRSFQLPGTEKLLLKMHATSTGFVLYSIFT